MTLLPENLGPGRWPHSGRLALGGFLWAIAVPGLAAQGPAGMPHDAPPPVHTEADVRFMQNMIHHHAQALTMAALVPDRSDREDIRLLAARIERSQGDEIALMERWLRSRGEPLPEGAHQGHDDPAHHPHTAPGAHRMPHQARGGPQLMAGMLSREEFAELAASRGRTFDRLFLVSMIRHHEGALDMVAELLSLPGAAQDAEIFQFAAEVDSDQRMEIARMQRMLRSDG